MKTKYITNKRYAILWIFLLVFLFCIPARTALAEEKGFSDAYYRVQDRGSILTEEEEQTLLSLLDEISIRQKMDVAIVTEKSLDGEDPQQYADNVYEYCQFGYGADKDGILLLMDMDGGNCTISTCGYGITAFTDAGIDYLLDGVTSSFADGAYATGLTTYANRCDAMISQARAGEPFNANSVPRKPLSQIWIVISLAVGLGVSALTVSVMKSQLKSVSQQRTAKNYVRPGSLMLTQQNDYFLYRNVNRIEKSKENRTSSGSTTHQSSSGTTHGGGSRKFK